jgi:hypothetical protein
MPQNQPTAPQPGNPEPAPVAILLPPPPQSDPSPDRPFAPDWHGVQPREVAGLIAAYTHRSDVVVSSDPHPTVTRAARYLGRHAAHLSREGDTYQIRSSTRTRRIIRRTGAGLVLAALPRSDSGTRLYDITAIIAAWRPLLRPGGHLLIAVNSSADSSPVSQRSQVITAARTAGLTWKQEFLVVRVPLPDHEPRTVPDTAAATPPALLDGRHLVIHTKLLAFAAPAEAPHA